MKLGRMKLGSGMTSEAAVKSPVAVRRPAYPQPLPPHAWRYYRSSRLTGASPLHKSERKSEIMSVIFSQERDTTRGRPPPSPQVSLISPTRTQHNTQLKSFLHFSSVCVCGGRHVFHDHGHRRGLKITQEEATMADDTPSIPY